MKAEGKRKGRTISFVNQKGGVGKSTTCFNVGAALARDGYKVLLVDMDPQGDCSTMFGYELDKEDLSTYEVLHGEDITQAIKTAGGLSMVLADEGLHVAEFDFARKERNVLRNALSGVKSDYDFILIDCPPALGVLTVNALAASDEVIIPVQAQYLPLRGVSRLRDTIEATRHNINKGLRIGGVVLTFYDERRKLDTEVRESIEEAFGGKVFKTKISRSIKLAEAPSFKQSIFEYSPRSKGAIQYKALAAEIAK